MVAGVSLIGKPVLEENRQLFQLAAGQKGQRLRAPRADDGQLSTDVLRGMVSMVCLLPVSWVP
jgi:hypothetical protein